MNAELQALYPSVEQQLAERERRHKAHQAMLDEHHERKHDRRDRHKLRNLKCPIYCLK